MSIEPIDLTWTRKIAVFWAIWWPSCLGSALVAIAISEILPFDPRTESSAIAIAVTWGLLALVGQAVFIPRVLRKRFRDYVIRIMRDVDPAPSQNLMWSEGFAIWSRIVAPQVALDVGLSVVAAAAQNFVSKLSSIWFFATIFVMGPLGVDLALKVSGLRFRLRAFDRYSHEEDEGSL